MLAAANEDHLVGRPVLFRDLFLSQYRHGDEDEIK